MEQLLIYIKHHFRFLWKFIELCNSCLFILFYSSKSEQILVEVLNSLPTSSVTYRELYLQDMNLLYNLIASQNSSDLKYFNPHGFDRASLTKQFRNPSFLMMGAFYGNILIGYFFLRFFANKHCFVGRLIDKNYRGKGIGDGMNYIMYETSWRMGFRCLSTISKQNSAVMRAHSKNNALVFLKDLQNDYILVEFIKRKDADKKSI